LNLVVMVSWFSLSSWEVTPRTVKGAGFSNARFAELRIQGLDHIQCECLPQDAVSARAVRIELPHDPSRRG
jgi:hypothetical protein